MDFKIGEEIEEKSAQTKKREKKTRKYKTIFIIVLALIIGIGVFLICNALFREKENKEVVESVELSLTEENVNILYKYVTYGMAGQKNDKFVETSEVTADSFTNQEKYYYALQFVRENDIMDSGRVTDKKEKIYMIRLDRMEKYMKMFFGSQVEYMKDINMTYIFDFQIENKNMASIQYSAVYNAYEVIFLSLEVQGEKEELVSPYYTKLSKAYRDPDGTYRLEEKVVYTKMEKQTEGYTVYVYKDKDYSSLIGTKNYRNEAELMQESINVNEYKNTTVVTYTFKPDLDNTLYFESSKLTVQ